MLLKDGWEITLPEGGFATWRDAGPHSPLHRQTPTLLRITPPPTFSPGVLHDPVAALGAAVGSILVPNCQHAMVELGAARLVPCHARGVKLERRVGADGHRHGLVCERLAQRGGAALGHVLEAVDGNDVAIRLLARLAGEVERPVAIVRLRVQPAVLHHVVKGVVHQPAAAAQILGVVAADQLLLRQGHQLAGADGVDALDGASGTAS